jgi:hypothetical protein
MSQGFGAIPKCLRLKSRLLGLQPSVHQRGRNLCQRPAPVIACSGALAGVPERRAASPKLHACPVPGLRPVVRSASTG